MELGLGQKLGINSGAAQNVQSYLRLLGDSIPKLQWKVFFGSAEDYDEVVLPSFDGPLFCIASITSV